MSTINATIRSLCEDFSQPKSPGALYPPRHDTADQSHDCQSNVDVEMVDSYQEDHSGSYESTRQEKIQYIKEMYLILNATDGGLKELLELNEEDREMMLDWLDEKRALQPEESRSLFERALDAEEEGLQVKKVCAAVPNARMAVFKREEVPPRWIATRKGKEAVAAAHFEPTVKEVESGVRGMSISH